MSKSGKKTLSLFSFFLRFLIVSIFLIGILPVPAFAQSNGTIAGQVSDNSTGNPIYDALVLVTESGSQIPVWNASTDTSGNYSISAVPGTGYQVAAYKDGYITGQSSGINVSANTTTTVDFSLVPGGIIQGIVTDNTSSPVQDADVRAYLPASPGTVYTSLPADSSGQYSLTAPPGTGYTVEVDKPGYSTANQTGIQAALGTPTTVNFVLQPPPPPPDTTPPADILDLAASNPTHNSVTLTWTAPGDDGTTGIASQYDIRFATSAITNDTEWNNATFIPNPLPPPSTAGSSENHTVIGLSDNTTFFFAIKTGDDGNQWSGLSNSPQATTIPEPSFVIANTDGKFSFMLGAGDNITETFDITSVNNFEGTVDLSFHGPPEIEASSNLAPTQVTLTSGQTQTLTLNLGASAMTPSGTYQCGIEGQTSAYGGQQRGCFITVIIGVPGQPLLSASPSMVPAGGETNFFASQFTPSENVTLRWDSGPKVGEVLATGQIAGDGTWNTTVTVPADMPGGNFAVEAIST